MSMDRNEAYKKYIELENKYDKEIKDPKEAFEFIEVTQYAQHAFRIYNKLFDELKSIYGDEYKTKLKDIIFGLSKLKRDIINTSDDKVVYDAIKILNFIKKDIVDISGED